MIVYCRQSCVGRNFGYGSIACVCNLTHCDDLEPLKITHRGVVRVFETSKDGDRFKETLLKFGVKSGGKASKRQTITIDRSKKYQSIIGFGGAFTDASGINIKSLPEKLQKNIIKDYFSDEGIEYSVGRIPIAGCDFSTRRYTYDDDHPGDFELKYFNLTKEDFDYKVCE